MAKHGGKRVKGETLAQDGPLPTLGNPEKTKHQTMIEMAASEAWTDAEIAIGIYDVIPQHFCDWVKGKVPSDPDFLDAYARAKALRSKAFRRRVWGKMDDVHEVTGPDGSIKRASRANAGLYALWARNVENWRVSDPKEDGDDKAAKSTMIYEGQLPDVLGNANQANTPSQAD
jgi:hypothetical protein